MSNKKDIGIEKLHGMGGFIGQIVKKEMTEKYSEQIVEFVMDEFPESGSLHQLIELADFLLKIIFEGYDTVYSQVEGMADADYNVKISNGIDHLSDFSRWFLIQNLRYLEQRIRKGGMPVMFRLPASSRLKNPDNVICPLEERIFVLSSGFEDGHKMTAGEIAHSPEFDCDPEWIIKVMKGLEETFSSDGEAVKELHMMCAMPETFGDSEKEDSK